MIRALLKEERCIGEDTFILFPFPDSSHLASSHLIISDIQALIIHALYIHPLKRLRFVRMNHEDLCRLPEGSRFTRLC